MKTQKEIIERILESANGEPVSFMKLCKQTGFNYRTVKRYIELIEYLQNDKNKVEIVRDGFRVLIKRPVSPPTHIP